MEREGERDLLYSATKGQRVMKKELIRERVRGREIEKKRD